MVYANRVRRKAGLDTGFLDVVWTSFFFFFLFSFPQGNSYLNKKSIAQKKKKKKYFRKELVLSLVWHPILYYIELIGFLQWVLRKSQLSKSKRHFSFLLLNTVGVLGGWQRSTLQHCTARQQYCTKFHLPRVYCIRPIQTLHNISCPHGTNAHSNCINR